MRAITFTTFGDPTVLTVTDQPIPEPAAGELRIRVEATTVNPVDLGVRAGAFGPDQQVRALGWDVAGTIDALGTGTGGFAVGDRVIAMANPFAGDPGTYAEFVVLKATAVAPAPAGASVPEAATLPLNGLTAAQAVDLLGLRPGQTLAVTGAAGAVGGFAVALAARAGLRVFGIAGPGDEEFVTAAGATFVPRSDEPTAALRALVPGGVDAVLDAASLGTAVLGAVRDGGDFVGVVAPLVPAPERDITTRQVQVRADGTRLGELSAGAERGELALRLASTLPFERAAEAHELVAKGRVRGRVVLVP